MKKNCNKFLVYIIAHLKKTIFFIFKFLYVYQNCSHTFWAAFSTGLGSVWHELGHCFGLDHYLHGIMNRGCDDIHLCIGFILPGLCCVHGCKSSIEKYSEFLKSNAKNNTLSQVCIYIVYFK